jgi:peroxin-2
MMFAVPLLSPIPDFLTPSSIISPVKTLMTQHTAIDYTSIPLLPPSTSTKLTKAHSGPLAALPVLTCPICHLRYTSTPQPISSTSTGSNIALPPIQIGELGEGQDGIEETRVFVPAKTDCWGGCEWCYYCIAGELATFEKAKAEKTSRGDKGKRKGNQAEEEKWMCLRCGGGVTRAWRVGVNVLTQVIRL